MLPGSLFEFTSRYVPAEQAQQLLALYALRQSVVPIPFSAIDDTVKWAKLKWWSEELAAEPESSARHPVLRAMQQSGARDKLENSLLLRLVSDAVMQMDELPDADTDKLYTRLSALGETDILLELALTGVEVDAQNVHSLALATGLFAVVSGFGVNYPDKIRFLPLEMLARHQISAARLQQNPPVAELVAMLTELAGAGVDAFAKGVSVSWLNNSTAVSTHLKLRWAMEARRLAWIQKNTTQIFGKAESYGPSDAWFAWKFCRRLVK